MAAAHVSDVMRILADPTRMAIYERIAERGEVTVAELTPHARVSQPAVSQHLKALQNVRLVVGRREGRNTYYRAEPQGLAPLADWMKQHERFWQQSLDRLGDYLREMQKSEANRGNK